MNTSAHDRNQLAPSIDKLMHYLLVYVNSETTIKVYDGGDSECALVYEKIFLPPTAISVSPTLYTRLDDCHGAGNCCRVPFDLIYTDYDRNRIINYDEKKIAQQFGQESADRFTHNRTLLLNSLQAMHVSIKNKFRDWQTTIYVQRNHDINNMSGTKSCPYLFIGGDRYFCGVHPFKPLHCWYPHMVVRANESSIEGVGPSVTIGRMQYGRNHNFGCPVLFTKSVQFHSSDLGLFEEPGTSGAHYFDQQFQDDIDKLSWTSSSAASMGFTDEDNFCVGIDKQLANKQKFIKLCLETGDYAHIALK